MQRKRGKFNGRRVISGRSFTEEMAGWFESESDCYALKVSCDNSSDGRYFNVCMLARTIADMQGKEKISNSDIVMAVKINDDIPAEDIYGK